MSSGTSTTWPCLQSFLPLLLVAVEILSRLDVWILRNGLHVIAYRFQCWSKHPARFHVVFPEIDVLPRIAAQIEKQWQIRLDDRLLNALGVTENYLHRIPLHRHQFAV